MNSPNDEATHSLLRETLKVSTGKVNSYKRILLNKHGLIRFIIKSIIFFGGLTIFGILLIYIYETIKTPKYDSVLYDDNYVCHDSKTCGIKYHGDNYNFTNDDDNNNDKEINNTTVAFFSSLYSDNYLKGALLLGYTIKKHNPNHQMYLQYFPGRLSIDTICQVQSIGWIMKPVERIPPPWKGLYEGYRDQYTKLRMWSFTEFKDGIIYLDSDTVVLKYIANLFELIKPSTGFEFAASPDLWDGKDSNTFNAGFMLLKPNIDVYNELMRTHNISAYEKGYAEQGFLNEFYRYRYLRLPETYNINISLMKTTPHLWKVLLPNMNVVHYTCRKPFLRSDPGIYAEPYEFWIKLYNEMDKDLNLEKLESECKNK
ncbi:hypothetical protein Glove_319g13 [Diversispora epigaea]|uniref:Nucleotide-diphospho-sugar transferase domain-containing protein n=1 Tax=Diversispora epigaea TaxID=1348612 RepID=A0A397HPZ4_9GLOM|nr:hypothetical protein Glove_319g13 [Diversispora epigaea]